MNYEYVIITQDSPICMTLVEKNMQNKTAFTLRVEQRGYYHKKKTPKCTKNKKKVQQTSILHQNY